MAKIALKIILYLWQLPQNLLGLIVVAASRAKKIDGYYYTDRHSFGVSLGFYIVIGGEIDDETIRHEQGHQKQSVILGPLYLLVIGAPSACGNLFDRLFHKRWSVARRIIWYYSLPWESWADKLGGVKRIYMHN